MKNKQLHHVLNLWKKISSGSVNRQIFGAAVTVTGMTLLVKIASVGKEFVVAWKFGISDQVDAFVIALLLPQLIVQVVAGSFRPAFIPTYIRVREQEGQEQAQKLLSGIIPYILGLLILITILIVAFAPFYLPIIASGFDSEKIDLTFKLLLAISPLILFNGILTICRSVLNSRERFALAAFLPISIPTLSILLMLNFPSWGVFALVAGLIGGTLIQVILLGMSLRQKGISLMPKLYKLDASLKDVFSLYKASATAAFIMGNTKLVDQSMAAILAPGSVAALSYGNKLIALPLNLTTIGLGTAIVPYFSKMIAREDLQGIRHTLKHYLKLIFITTIPLTVILSVFAVPIVQLLLERGEFTANDTSLVAQIQGLYALQIPFYAANILLVRLITSMSMNYALVWISLLNTIMNISLNYVLIEYLGVAGIALSTSLVYVFSALLVFLVIRRKINYESR